jgi:hypothetical protein
METIHVTSVHEQCTRQRHAGYRGRYYFKNYFLFVFYLIRSNLYKVTGLFIKTDNVRIIATLRRVRITIVAAEKQEVLHNLSVCVCALI